MFSSIFVYSLKLVLLSVTPFSVLNGKIGLSQKLFEQTLSSLMRVGLDSM